MNYDYTKRTANWCVSQMKESRFVPQSIINVGVSSGPECLVWKKSYPNVPVVGIDPRAKRDWVTFPYFQAVATNSNEKFVLFCFGCMSLICLNPENHKKRNKWQEVRTIKIDNINAELIPPPHFMWMDIEGSEISALESARKTLKQTKWICIETFDWVSGHASDINEWLQSNGFEIRYQFDTDALYQRVLPLGQLCESD